MYMSDVLLLCFSLEISSIFIEILLFPEGKDKDCFMLRTSYSSTACIMGTVTNLLAFGSCWYANEIVDAICTILVQ